MGDTSIQLSTRERRALQGIASKASGRASVRATVVLMSAEGSDAKTIARILGVGLRTVRRTRRRWRSEGLGGLDDALRSGRPVTADTEYLELVCQVVRTDPRKLGYCFAHWTAPRLAAYLHERTGIQLCDDWVRMLLKAQGFVWRKTKLTIRNLQDPRKKRSPSSVSGDYRGKANAPAPRSSCGTATGYALISCP